MRLLGIGLAAFALCLSVDAADIPALFRDMQGRLDPAIPVALATNAYARPVIRWTIPQLELQTNNHMRVYRENGQNEGWFSVVAKNNGHEERLLHIKTRVCANMHDAQKAVVHEMNNMTSTWRYKFDPLGKGDYCFRLIVKGRFEDWLFCRNNVMVNITSSQNQFFPVEEIARQIDADILKRSLEPPSSEEGR